MNLSVYFTSLLVIIAFKFCLLNADGTFKFRYYKQKRLDAPALLQELHTNSIFDCTRACRDKKECGSAQLIHGAGETICQILSNFTDSQTLVDDVSTDLIGKIGSRCVHGGSWNSTLQKCVNCTHGFVGQLCDRRIIDCTEGADNGYTEKDETIYIQPMGAIKPVWVMCQYRYRRPRTHIGSRGYCGSPETFTRSWFDYKHGFGDPNCDNFIGLENIHLLTKQRDVTLRIQMNDKSSVVYECFYRGFSVDSEDNKYALHYGEFKSVSLADAFGMGWPNGSVKDAPFCTPDNDCGSCANTSMSGWWFSTDCSHVNFHQPPSAEYLVAWPVTANESIPMKTYHFSLIPYEI